MSWLYKTAKPLKAMGILYVIGCHRYSDSKGPLLTMHDLVGGGGGRVEPI